MKNSVNTYKMNSTKLLVIFTLIIALIFCLAIKGFSQPNPGDTTKGSVLVPNLKLQGYMTSNNGLSDAVVVYFHQSATMLFSGNTDATKMMNTDPGIPNIYAVKDNMMLAVSAFPELINDLEIPIGFEVLTDGTYTIIASELTNFDSAVRIYLEDKARGITQDLTENPTYNFVIHKVDKGDRFFLKFNFATAGIKNVRNSTKYNVYSFNNNLYVSCNNPKGELATLTLYSAQGQKVLEKQIENGNYNYGINNVPGCYILKIVNKDEVYTDKIFIK